VTTVLWYMMPCSWSLSAELLAM